MTKRNKQVTFPSPCSGRRERQPWTHRRVTRENKVKAEKVKRLFREQAEDVGG